MADKLIPPEYLLAQLNIGLDDISYSLKLSNIIKRRTAEPVQGKFGGLMSGLGNAINDTISSAVHDAFLVRTNGGMVWVLSDKISPSGCKIDNMSKTMDIDPGEVKISAVFNTGEIESVAYVLSNKNAHSTFSGSVKQLIADFGDVVFENMPDYFVTAEVSKILRGEKIYKFTPIKTQGTLIAYNEGGITLLNEHRRFEFKNMLSYHKSEGYCAFIALENCELVLVELFVNAPDKLPETELNLLRKGIGDANEVIDIPVSENVIRAENFLAAFETSGLNVVCIDNKIYTVKNSNLCECGFFCVAGDVYVKTSDGSTKMYANCEEVFDVLTLLPCGYDAIFLNTECAQPFLYNGEIVDFNISDKGIKCENAEYEYAKMSSCRYTADDFGCRISFEYDGKRVGMTTANSLGVYVCNMQEKVFVHTITNEYNVNQLYDCFYKRCNQNFLASTFAEIFKTEKLLNVGMSLDEIITVIKSDDSEVLRNAFQSVVGKFKNVEDIQTDLIQKVTLLEIQRKKIQKIFDEWVLYYPHYMATMQIKWLKYVFGTNVSGEVLNSEYWKCVAQYKRILSGANGYIQKNMNEIGGCINKITQALPDDVKRTDITGELRINSSSSRTKLNAGTDVLMGVTAGVELANILVRGFTAANPLAISLTAKMLVESYTKDVALRKNVKAFGLQALEWWEIFMSGIRIQIIELSNAAMEYNKVCLKRDTELFKKNQQPARDALKDRLRGALREKIAESIDDKFVEILPQFNMRISNIVDEIDTNTEFLNLTIDEFKNNLFR